MANLSAAFQGVSQGLDQLAERANQREMMQAQMMRAENLAALRNYYATHRQLEVTAARGKTLIDVTDHRTAAQHQARTAEIAQQEKLRGENQAAAQGRQAKIAQSLQNGRFDNRLELQGRAGRTQAWRQTVLGRQNASRAMTATMSQMMTRLHQLGASSADSSALAASLQGGAGAASDPVTAARLKAYMGDGVLNGIAGQYRDAYNTYNSMGRMLQKAGSPYATDPGATVDMMGSSSDAGGASSAAPPPSEGPGTADQQYPDDSAADSAYMNAPEDGGGDDSDEGAGDGSP